MSKEDSTTDGGWCANCHGQGGWEEDGAERGDFGDTEWIECPTCNGTGDDGVDDAAAPTGDVKP